MATRTRARPLRARPSVSVVIPCYNYGRFLPGCVYSALDQPGVAVEVVVVNDASTDDSAAVAHRLAAEDPRVRVISRAVNMGHIHTFNEGIDAATGEYLVLLSADDLLAPGALGRSAAVMQHHSRVGLVYGFAPVFTDRPPRPRTRTWGWTIWTGQGWLEQFCLRGRNVMHSPEAMMRTSVLRDIGGYNPEMPKNSDFYMWLCAAAHADVAYVDGPDQAYYRRHGKNMSESTRPYGEIDQHHHAFMAFFARYGSDLRDPERLQEMAFRAMSREALARAGQMYVRGVRPGEDPTAFGELAEKIWPPVRESEDWAIFEGRMAHHDAGGRGEADRVLRQAARAVARDAGRRLGLRRLLHFGTPTALG